MEVSPHSRPLDSAQAASTDTTASKIVQGLFNSNHGNIAPYIAEIPCNDIYTLESDALQAKQFVQQIEAGQVPSIVTNLPQEAVDEFKNVLNILTILPEEVINVAEAAVTDVVKIVDDIEDGSITTVLAALPSEIAAGVTEGWGDFTAGLTNAWKGLTNGFDCVVLNKCPTTPVETCGTPLTGAATTAAIPTMTPILPAALSSSASVVSASSARVFNQSTPLNGAFPSLAGRSFEWAVGSLLGIAVAGILGLAILL